MVTSSSGTFSPPPIDPPFDSPSNRLSTLPDIDGILRKHHSRKRVTFDLNPNSILTTSGATPRLLHSMMTSSATSSAQNDVFGARVDGSVVRKRAPPTTSRRFEFGC
ncbi:hypothetical protein GCK72_003852 [Caenorhabditis remanei]|uniref:Uncharacterized protein n=1 Tax=Caenorhabditis remanei TaxID=31234 RepID=A0A6A5HAN3_CAERE|nr:hypothetical protein GCK72_003852 [Caenorhabditis remanei]KAF1763906.1 hypothetical protein GCK72_003852 [Caenorhabditis remanei]